MRAHIVGGLEDGMAGYLAHIVYAAGKIESTYTLYTTFTLRLT